MELTRDVYLRGATWAKAIDTLTPIFRGRSKRTNYNIFMVALSIGIMYDKRIEKFDDESDEVRNVPRNVLQNNDNGKLELIFQAAILSTMTEQMPEEQRLELAFGESAEFDKIGFLTEFANYGITKLVTLIGSSTLESMENIKNFVASTVEGRNLDIDTLPDDILLDEDL